MTTLHMRHFLLVLATCFFIPHIFPTVTTSEKHDPLPLHTSAQPYSFLDENEKFLRHCNYTSYEYFCENFAISISPFYQKASRGRDFEKRKAYLGDLEGRWNMLSLLYGPALSNLTGTQLGYAKPAIFPTISANDTVPTQSILFDPNHLIGNFAVPIRYRRSGLRFELTAGIDDFGISVYGGVSEIKQTVTQFVDLTPDAYTTNTASPFYPTQPIPTGFTETVTTLIEEYLMTYSSALAIFNQIGLNTCDFQEASFEDLYVNIWWRHIFTFNMSRDPAEWAHFSFIPFLSIDVSFPTSRTRDQLRALALAFGNDGHWATGMTAGWNIDFHETVEIGMACGFNYFWKRRIDTFYVPTSPLQYGIFPYYTSVEKRPGMNIFFNAQLNVYRFIDKLSFYAQYFFVHHQHDRISVLPGPNSSAFLPGVLNCRSKFRTHVLNTALNYDISPHVSLGCVVQWPLMQENSYRSTTFMATLRFLF